MALAFKITKAKYDALSEDMKKEYLAGEGEGEYVLDVLGIPAPEDTGPLKRSLEAERGKVKDIKAKLDEANGKLAEVPNIDEMKANHEKEVGKYKSFTENTLIDSVAMSLASKISKAPALLAPVIKARLVADMSGDTPVTRIKGADGKVVADFTIDKLGEELVANKDYAAIMIASQASGGGAPRSPAIKPLGGGAPQGEQSGQTPDLSTMKPSDLAARISERKAAEASAA